MSSTISGIYKGFLLLFCLSLWLPHLFFSYALLRYLTLLALFSHLNYPGCRCWSLYVVLQTSLQQCFKICLSYMVGCIVLVYIVLVSCLDTSLPPLYFSLTCSWFSFRLVADIAFLRAQILFLYLKMFQFLYSFCVLLKENLTHLHVNIAIQFNAHIIND